MARQNHIFRKIRVGSQAERLMDQLVERPESSRGISYDTVAKIADGEMALRVSCQDCGAKVVYAGEDLKAEFGADTSIRDVKPACSNCGSTATEVMPQSA